jgi:hypothetical protein
MGRPYGGGFRLRRCPFGYSQSVSAPTQSLDAFICLLCPSTLVLFYDGDRRAVHIVGRVLATMTVDQLSDLLGTATGGDIAFGTWTVFVERSYEAKNPSNTARSFTTVPIGAPCLAGHITLPQHRLLCGRDLHCGNDDRSRCREGTTHNFHWLPPLKQTRPAASLGPHF